MKQYLSRSEARAWSLEVPVGDPFGGPAYGERNDPGTMAVVANIGTILGTVGAAKTLIGGGPKPAAPVPVAEAPKVMPSADTASQAALLAKKKAASAQTSGRMSTILSQGDSNSNTLGG